MIHKRILITFALVGILSGLGWVFQDAISPGKSISAAATAFLETLDDQQRKTVVHRYDDTPQRVDWHFIPKDQRKGLQVKHMNEAQREAAQKLLRSCLSQMGFKKATTIMKLESVLHELEQGKGRNIRDPERYYYSVFGDPAADKRWGLSIEGHHLSLNFVIEQGAIISSTPTFFAANPGEMKSAVLDVAKGTRVLAKEETLAFELVNALDAEQAKQAIIADKAPREIRAAGEPQPPTDEPVGISFTDLRAAQRQLLRQLVTEYADSLPGSVKEKRFTRIIEAGPDNVHFAWAGATKPGVGHYYRIQGPTFLIEFVNTQPDAAGNPANHIHCVWRDMQGDFALPIKKG